MSILPTHTQTLTSTLMCIYKCSYVTKNTHVVAGKSTDGFEISEMTGTGSSRGEDCRLKSTIEELRMQYLYRNMR